MKSNDLKLCIDKLKMYYGIAPYDDNTNYAKGDSWFYSSILKEFKEKTIKLADKQLNGSITISIVDFLELIRGYKGFIDSALPNNYSKIEKDFYNRMKDTAIEKGLFYKEKEKEK